MGDSRTVLVADGSPSTIPELSDPLREMGLEVVVVRDAHYVLTMAMRNTPALVLLGARLPAGGALTALRRLRASVHTASIPVIALASPGPGKQAVLSAGAEVCLEPPASAADLLPHIRKHLGLSRAPETAPADILGDPERLSDLSGMQLLDTDPDEALDVVTRLAAQVLGVPVALVSLVDNERQFFKSQVGLPSPWDGERQTPLTHSFCQWVVSSQDELVVEDARTHPILRRNRAIADLGVIAYAGVPLSAISGRPIGSFCAIDGQPRDWPDNDLATLRDLAQLVNAHTAVNLPQSDPRPGSRHPQFLAITRAAGRGFVGAARLLRRGHPALNVEQRHAVAGVVERLSHQLLECAAEMPAPDEEQGVGVVDLVGSNP